MRLVIEEIPGAVAKRTTKYFKRLYSQIPEQVAKEAVRRQSLLDSTTDQPPNLEGDYVPASPVNDVAAASVDDHSFSSIDDILPPPMEDDSFSSIDDAPPADDHAHPPRDGIVPPSDSFPPPMDEDNSDLPQDEFASLDDILLFGDEDFSASDISEAGLTSSPNSDTWVWTPNFVFHLNFETPSGFKCPFCPEPYTFKTNAKLRQHLGK